ncbi:MAG: membrane integrity-associated transporter subunit PqiC [Steroidobacteraceae bacterium]
MIRVIAAIAAAWALTVLFAGCASTSAHLYTLSASSSAASNPDPSLSKLVIVIGPVLIPAIVDVPQIVVRNGPNQVTLDEFNRWASPLKNNIAQVVADDLVAMLGASRVSSALSMDADYRVAIDVQIFESAPGDAATLSALWSVRRVKDNKTESGRTVDREPVSQKSYEALAAAHSRALGRLSADIAEAIRALDHAGQ